MFRFISYIILLLFFISLSTYSKVVPQGKIYFDGKGTLNLKKGETFKGVLEIWPKGKLKLEDFEELVGNTILDLFYITKIEKINLSPNNHELIQIKFSGVLVNLFKNNNLHLLAFNNLNITVFIDKIKVIPDELQEVDSYLFFNHSYLIEEESSMKFILILKILGVMILLIIFYVVKVYLNKKNKGNCIPSVEIESNDVECILRAQNRSDFEKVYIYQLKLEEIFLYNQSFYTQYLDKIKALIYMRDWSDTDLDEIKDLYEKMGLKLKDGISI